MTTEFGYGTRLSEADEELLEELLDRLEMEDGGEYESGVSGVQSSNVKMYFGLDTFSGDGNVNPDWAKARDEGSISFAIIKSNEGILRDASFAREWPKIKEAGLVRGAYLLPRFPSSRWGQAASQAKAFIRTVGRLDPSDLPPALDVEFPGGRVQTGMKPQQLVEGMRAAWRVLRDYYGAAPMIYTSARVWIEELTNPHAPDLVESPLWLGGAYPFKEGSAVPVHNPKLFARAYRPPPVPRPWGDKTNWWIHQYQGEALRLPGFKKVDMNLFNTIVAGATGERVKWVQRRLGIMQSGVFDAATKAALGTFQANKGLVANSVIDPRTFAFLCWSSP